MTLTEELRRHYAPGVAPVIEVPDRTVADMLFDVARRYPERAALDFFSRSTTYRQLAERVRRGAGALAAAGVRPGDRVALVMPNCPAHVEAVFATMLLGAIAVEHNPMAPAHELANEFAAHGAKVVIAWENSVAKLGFLAPDVVVFGMDLTRGLPRTSQALLRLPLASARARRAELTTRVPARVRPWHAAVEGARPFTASCPVGPGDPALLIHTGGTTGVPKAAVLTHRNILANIEQDIAWVSVLHEGAEVFYCVLPLFHAFGFGAGCLAGIRLGATLALFPKFDTTMVLTSQKRLPCTFFMGVTPMYERLLRTAAEMGSDLSSMKYSLCGAMPMSPELAARWEEASGGLVIEGYGMTEASPVILGNPLSPERRPGALGLPFPSTEVRIVDPEDISRDVATGEVGELICRGPQVFSGYWGRPDETAEVLVDGWLRTGDLVRVDRDTIVMADRRKEMINSSGFNVYPSQVEEAVRSMPGVRDVAVVGVPAGTSNESVVAAIVLEAGASVTLEDVRTWAEKSLAHYALPRQLVVMSELPRSQIGKVVRRRVREEIIEGVQQRAKALAEHAQVAMGQAQVAVGQTQEAVSAAAAEASAKLRELRDQRAARQDAGPSSPADHAPTDPVGDSDADDDSGSSTPR